MNLTSPSLIAYNCSPSFGGTADGCGANGNELGYMFYYDLGGSTGNARTGDQTVDGLTLYDIQSVPYWSGTVYDSSDAWDRHFDGSVSTLHASQKFRLDSVWAVRGGDVPEPGTLALLGIALAGLGFGRRKQS